MFQVPDSAQFCIRWHAVWVDWHCCEENMQKALPVTCARQRPLTFLLSPSLEHSSICLTPLTRASMTRVDVTSFSLKKRFTTPCAQPSSLS